MSDLSNAFHQGIAALNAGLASLKSKLAAAEPSIAALFTDEVNTLEGAANTLTAQGVAILAADAQGIPVIGPAISAAITASGPTVEADLKSAYAQFGTLLEGLEQSTVAKIAGS